MLYGTEDSLVPLTQEKYVVTNNMYVCFQLNCIKFLHPVCVLFT